MKCAFRSVKQMPVKSVSCYCLSFPCLILLLFLLWEANKILPPPWSGTMKSFLILLPRWQSGKESACQCKRCKRLGFDPWGRKVPCERKWQPTPVFLLGKSHGQRIWQATVHRVAKESDMATTYTHIAFSPFFSFYHHFYPFLFHPSKIPPPWSLFSS